MKAIVITESGGPEVLKIEERPTPSVADHEVLIRIYAAGVNRPDVFQRKGNYAAPNGVVADIPGLEASGVIEAVGSAVTRWKPNDRVCCLVAGGSYAEFVAAHENLCLPIPQGFSYAEAASLPETVFTVWDNVFRRAFLKAGEGILIHGGAGGIGSTAIQLAKAFGARVFTTVSTEEKYDFCKSLGADIIINYKEEDFAERLANEKVDVVLDSIAGVYFAKHIDLLAHDGRLIQINAMQGAKVELNVMKMMSKRLLLTGSTLRSRDLKFKTELAQDVLDKVWPIMGEAFKPLIHAEVSFVDAPLAHQMMELGDLHGKVVLIPEAY